MTWRIVHNRTGAYFAGLTVQRDRPIWTDCPRNAETFEEDRKSRVVTLLLRMGNHDVRREEA